MLCDPIAACANEQGPQLSEEELQRRKEERARKREESRLAFLAACEKGPRVAIDCEWTPQLTDKVLRHMYICEHVTWVGGQTWTFRHTGPLTTVTSLT